MKLKLKLDEVEVNKVMYKQREYPQSNFYYLCILLSLFIWCIGCLLDIYWIHPDEGIFAWVWDFWATGLIIQWIVYIFRMLHIRAQFRQSKKDGIPIISDKSHKTNTCFKYLFCIPWWATKIDDTAIDLIGQEYRKYIAKNKQDFDTVDVEDNEQTVTL